MKVLITGATGLIGKELVKYLLTKKYEINFLTTSKNKTNSLPNCNGYYWNTNTKEIDSKCIENVTVIINLAGTSIAKPWTKSYKKEILNSRLNAIETLYELLKKTSHSVTHFISASGIDIYPNNCVCDESCNATSHTFLGKVVTSWENAVLQLENLNIKTTRIRTAVVFSKKGSAFSKLIMPIKLGIGASIGSGKQNISWIHIDDLINIYVLAIEKSIFGVINAVAPEYITNEKATQILAKKLKKPLWLPNIPIWFLKILIGNRHVLVTANKEIYSSKTKNYNYKYPTFYEAVSELL